MNFFYSLVFSSTFLHAWFIVEFDMCKRLSMLNECKIDNEIFLMFGILRRGVFESRKRMWLVT